MQAHLIPNRHKVIIAMTLLPSSLQNKPHNQHIHTFTDRSYRNGLPSRAISTSPGISKKKYTSNIKLRTSFKKTSHWHKWLVSHLNFSDKLDILQYNFTSGEARSGIDGYYRSELGMSSSAQIIESSCGTQYIQGGGMVPGKPKYQNSFWGELWGQLGVMCAIEIMESILGRTTLVVNSCDNISALKQAMIHPEAVK